MPTKVMISCPICGIVETYNYIWPSEQPVEQECPFCKSISKFMECELIPVELPPRVVQPPAHPTEEAANEAKKRKQRK